MKWKILSLIILVLLLVFSIMTVYFWWLGNQRIQQSSIVDNKDNSFEQIRLNGELLIGVFPYIQRMNYVKEDGEYVGLDIDLVKAITAQLGLKPVFRMYYRFSDLLDALQRGDVDLAASSITYTTERASLYQLSEPYLKGGFRAIIRSSDNDIKSWQDLKGKKVMVAKGSILEVRGEEYLGKENLVSVDHMNLRTIIEYLSSRKADAALAIYPEAIEAKFSKNKSIKVSSVNLTNDNYVLAMHKDKLALLKKINSALLDITNSGQLSELTKKWLDNASVPIMKSE